MCLIMFSRNVNRIQDDWYKNSKTSNKDGLGVMFPENGRLIVKKALSDKDQDILFEEVKHRVKPGTPVATHQRFGTSGAKDTTNVHPFKLLSIDEGDSIDLYMMHNGIIDIKEIGNLCDTATYAEYVLRPMLKKDNNLWRTHAFKVLMDLGIGSSKLLFMDNKGNVEFVGEDRGEWRKKVWLSTPSYVEYSRYSYDDDFYYGYNNSSYPYSGNSWYQEYLKKREEERLAEEGIFITGQCEYCGKQLTNKDDYYYELTEGFCVCKDCKNAGFLEEYGYTFNLIKGE